MPQRRLVRWNYASLTEAFYLVSAFQKNLGDGDPEEILVGGQFLLEPAVGDLAGRTFEPADAQQALIAAQAVEKTVGVALVERVLHDQCSEHGVSRVAWVPAVCVGRVEHFRQIAGTRDCPLDQDLKETEAAFRGLFVIVGIIRIEIAHDDFCRSEGASDRLELGLQAVNFFVRLFPPKL